MLSGHGLLHELHNICSKFDGGRASQERLLFTLKMLFEAVVGKGADKRFNLGDCGRWKVRHHFG